MQVRGKIIEEQKNYYTVDTSVGTVRSELKGKIKQKEKRLYVGDIVTIEFYNQDPPEAVIRELHPRVNFLSKPAVANIDLVFFVNTFKEPAMDYEFIDRFLFMAQVYRFPVVLVFNKDDMLLDSERAILTDILSYYEKIGFPGLLLSAKTGDHLKQLIDYGKEKISILAGLSGVGKSTILSSIFPQHTFRTGELSKSISRGMHITTATTLLKLPHGGYMADTPGFSYISLPIVDEETVGHYFSEIDRASDSCKFTNCIHDNEPGCAVKEMVAQGTIKESRYEMYLKIHSFMKNKRREYSKK